MSWLTSSIATTMFNSILLTLVYFYLFLQYKERYIGIWSCGWLIYSIAYIITFWMIIDHETVILIIIHEIFTLISGLLLLWGTYEFLGEKIPKWWVYSLIPGTVWIGFATLSDLSFLFLTLPTYFFLGFTFVSTGIVINRFKEFRGIGRIATGAAFILWGVFKGIYPFLYNTHWFMVWSNSIVSIFIFIMAIGILLIFFQRMREDLRQSEARFRLLAENAQDAIYRIRLKPNFEFDYISPAIQSIIGYSPDELYDNPTLIYKIVYPKDRTLLQAERFKDSTIIRWLHKNGQMVWVEHNNVLITNQEGEMIVLEGIARNITERKKAEQEMLKAKERAARAEKMASLGTMAAGITHEINQPLNSLKIIADSLLYWYRKKKTMEISDVMEKIKKISNQAEKIDNIIKHIRDFIRPEISPQLTPTNLNDVVIKALSLIGTQLSSHGIAVKKDLQKELPLIKGDPIRLEEVVINLLINAMQALDEVEKNDKQIRCATRVVGNTVVLEISDNGPGIKKDIKDKIFEPFFTTKELAEGMGLGLYIVHSIVTSHKGRITVKNDKKGGARFLLEFPL